MILKKVLIEKDEFDQSDRLILNYGHTFGHAIETASNYSIPHGIAVSIGCQLANYISFKLNYSYLYNKTKEILEFNYHSLSKIHFNFTLFLNALQKDKKNSGKHYSFILPEIEINDEIHNLCFDFLKSIKSLDVV